STLCAAICPTLTLCGSPPFLCYVDPRSLPSFPTRRSSDLRLVDRLQLAARPVGRVAHEGLGTVLLNHAVDHGRRTEPRPSCATRDRKSTRLNSSHVSISYAVFCLKKKNTTRCCLTRRLDLT